MFWMSLARFPADRLLWDRRWLGLALWGGVVGCVRPASAPSAPPPAAPTTLWFANLPEWRREAGQLMRVPLGGGPPELVVASLEGRYDVSPSGRRVAWTEAHHLWIDGVERPDLGDRVDSPLFVDEDHLDYVRRENGTESVIAELDLSRDTTRDRYRPPSVWADVGLMHGPNDAVEFVSLLDPMALRPDDTVIAKDPRGISLDWRADGRVLVWDSRDKRLTRVDSAGQAEHVYERGILLGGFVGDDQLLLESFDAETQTVRISLTDLDGQNPRVLVQNLPTQDAVLTQPWCVLDGQTFVLIGDGATSIHRVEVTDEDLRTTPLADNLSSASWLKCR